MTPTRLRECLTALDWSQRGLARLLDRSEGHVRQWARGVAPVPPHVAAWLETLTAAHEANPPPHRHAAPHQTPHLPQPDAP